MLIGYKKGGAGYVLIKVHSLHETASGIKGLNGKEIMVDASYAPERHVRTSGEVIQLPFYMGSTPFSQIPIGTPSYGAIREITMEGDIDEAHPALYSIGGFFEYKLTSDILPEVQLKDKIYFPWKTLHAAKNMIAETTSKDATKVKTWIYKVPYDSIYCVVRDEQIIMIGSWVLIDPIWESWESILRPTFYPFKNLAGEFEKRPKSEWLQVKVAPSKMDRQGVVAHVGSPLKGEKCNFATGDRVLFRPNLRNLVTIEGKKYFVMRQEHVVCKVHEYEEK